MPPRYETAGMTSSLSRRRLLSSAVAVAGVGLFGAAARARAASLPDVGQTFELSLNVFGATMMVNLPPPLPTLNFLGSRSLKITSVGDGQVGYQTLAFTLQAFHPLFGTITVALPEDGEAGSGTLQMPNGDILDTWHQPMTMTLERCTDCPGPFRFDTVAAARWQGSMPSFPPPAQGTDADGSPTGGVLYQSQEPIGFGLPGSGAGTQARSRKAHDLGYGHELGPLGNQPNPDCPGCTLSNPLPGQVTGGGADQYVQLQGMNANQGLLTS